MKIKSKQLVITGIILLGLLVWIIMSTHKLIVCRLTPKSSITSNYILGELRTKTSTVKDYCYIASVGSGWKGLANICWAPSLLFMIIGSAASFNLGQQLKKVEMEEAFPYASNLAEKAAAVKRGVEIIEDDWAKLEDEKKVFNNLRSKIESESMVLKEQLQKATARADEAEQRLNSDRRDHTNRREKINNLENKVKKLEAEKLDIIGEKINSERKCLDLEKKVKELEDEIKNLKSEK
jgi:hypothetical protein